MNNHIWSTKVHAPVKLLSANWVYIHNDILQISILGHIFILYIYNSPYLFYDYVDTGVI